MGDGKQRTDAERMLPPRESGRSADRLPGQESALPETAGTVGGQAAGAGAAAAGSGGRLSGGHRRVENETGGSADRSEVRTVPDRQARAETGSGLRTLSFPSDEGGESGGGFHGRAGNHLEHGSGAVSGRSDGRRVGDEVRGERSQSAGRRAGIRKREDAGESESRSEYRTSAADQSRPAGRPPRHRDADREKIGQGGTR